MQTHAHTHTQSITRKQQTHETENRDRAGVTGVGGRVWRHWGNEYEIFQNPRKTGAHSRRGRRPAKQTTAVQLWQWHRGQRGGRQKRKNKHYPRNPSWFTCCPNCVLTSPFRVFPTVTAQVPRIWGRGRRPWAICQVTRPPACMYNCSLGKPIGFILYDRESQTHPRTHIHEGGENVPGFRCKLVFFSLSCHAYFSAPDRPCPGLMPTKSLGGMDRIEKAERPFARAYLSLSAPGGSVLAAQGRDSTDHDRPPPPPPRPTRRIFAEGWS